MHRHRLKSIFALVICVCLSGRAGASERVELNLWEGDPPGSLAADAPPESTSARGGKVNVSIPGLVVHLPPAEKATGLAFIVAPGGSYREVGQFETGMGTVDLYVPRGIAVIVLKYRTRPPSSNVLQDALADAGRAVRLVRHRAHEWNIDPQRIGMIGSSAGSHLILNLATHWTAGQPDAVDPVERQSSRPSFLALLCPWPNKQAIDQFPITGETPPAFIAAARDDTVAPIGFAHDIVAACERAGVPARLWTVESGGHTAFRIAGRGEGSRWPEQFWSWLEERGFLGAAPSSQ